MARAREEGARSFWLTFKEMRTGRRDLDDRDVADVKSGPRTQCTDRSLCCLRFVRGKRRSGVDTSGDCGLGGLLETGHESALLCGRMVPWRPGREAARCDTPPWRAGLQAGKEGSGAQGEPGGEVTFWLD